MTADKLELSKAHRQMLTQESGLREETIATRGYRTVSGGAGEKLLRELGFNRAQAATARTGDVLLVPMYDSAGNVVSHQIRPDKPRITKGRGTPLKYETAAGKGNRVDVPPAGREAVLDGSSPIWITEGAKTADAIAQTGAGVLMLAGVWGFMGRAALDQGTAVISDLLHIPMEDRQVYLAYDSDVVTKESVKLAEQRLAQVLSGRGAKVETVRIPPGPNGEKVGADDYLVAGGTLERLIGTAAPPEQDPLGGMHPYNFAYKLLRDQHETAMETAGGILRRPLDANGLPAGPGRRYTRDQMKDKVLHLADMVNAAHLIPREATAHAVARLLGDLIERPVPPAPTHITFTEGVTWVDMGTDIGHDVVQIGPSGWGYAQWSEVPFWIVRDHDWSRPLAPPAPPEERSWEPLRALLEIDDDAFAVVRLWLVSLLVCRRVPVLWWRGGSGSGKSTRAEIVGRLLGLPELATPPLDKQAALAGLLSNPWLSVENLGKLAPDISDVWCVAITEGMVTDRILYTQRMARVPGRWTGQITSIADVSGALDDLVSRSLTIHVDPPAQPRDRSALLRLAEQAAPMVRGALFDDAVKVMATLTQWQGETAGGYRFPAVAAAAQALDRLEGTRVHQEALADAAETTLAERSENSPWVQWVVELTRKSGGQWQGTASELLNVQRTARMTRPGAMFSDEEQWPGSSRAMGRWLSSKQHELEIAGVRAQFARENTKERKRRWVLTEINKADVTTEEAPERPANVRTQNPRSFYLSSYLDVKDVIDGDVVGDVGGVEDKDVRRGGLGGSREFTVRNVQTAERPVDLQERDGHSADVAAVSGQTAAEQAESAESGYPLPAVVLRDGVIKPIPVGEARDLLAAATQVSGALTVDVETSGYPVGHKDYRLRTVQLGDQNVAVVLDPHDPDQAEVVRAALAPTSILHAHSAAADLVPLVDAGLVDESAWNRMFDTVIPAKLADPQSTGSDPGLKQLSGTVLAEQAVTPAADAARDALFKRNRWRKDVDLATPVERSGWAQVDVTCHTQLRYAGSDVLDTAALAKRLPWPQADLLHREREVQRIVARVSHQGLAIDRAQVARLQDEHRPKMQAAAGQVRSFGVDNPGSDRQLAVKLTELGVALPRTKPSARHPQGQPSVAAGVLEALHNTAGSAGELISALLAYRHHKTALSTFLGPYAALCDHGDGRARPVIYTLGADTGRMSCVRPNFQNVPRVGGFRACICADPGYRLISADFSGVEIRVMAALSQDPDLIRMITEGAAAEALVATGQMDKREWQTRYDLHSRVAAEAFGPEWIKSDRYTAKRGVFGWAYGGGIPSLARQLGVPEHVMAAVVDSLALVAPGYVAWSDSLKTAVRAGAWGLPTYAGRTIHFDRRQPHKAANYAVQGTARELLVDALLKWDATPYGGGVVLPVHDEIVAMVPEDQAEQATAALVECMTTQLYGVPIVAEASAPSIAWQDSA